MLLPLLDAIGGAHLGVLVLPCLPVPLVACFGLPCVAVTLPYGFMQYIVLSHFVEQYAVAMPSPGR